LSENSERNDFGTRQENNRATVEEKRIKREREELGQACKASRGKEGNERRIDETRIFTASLLFSARKPLLTKLFQNRRILNGTEINDRETKLFLVPFR
jgi:hypothetical protein